MNKKAFRQLLRKYLNNTCTEEEKRIVGQWYDLLDSNNTILLDEDMVEIENRLWDKIKSSTKDFKVEPIVTTTSERTFSWRHIAAAASLIGICLILALQIFVKDKKFLNTPLIYSETGEVEKQVKKGFLQMANNSDTMQNFDLDDGSSIAIYPGAKLAYPKHFALEKREVYLEGDASFSISKNPNRPFFVYNDQIVTQVLGTSFTVQNKNGKIEVAVKTGRVAVYENVEQINLNEIEQKSNGVIITPNQKVTYYQEERHFVTSIVDQPAPVPAEINEPVITNHFSYNETPLFKVLEDLENTYKLEIVLENEKIKNCLFTGDLSGQNMFNKLESICLVFSSSYEIKGTRILLKSGKDCD